MLSLRFACAFLALSAAPVALIAQPQSQLSFTTVLPGDIPVLNKPYLAHQHLRAERHLPDGTLLVREFDITEGRNAAGVTVTEMHLDPDSPASTPAQAAVDFHFVADPAHRTTLQWNNISHLAVLRHIPARPLLLNTPAPPHPEPLGHRVVAGYDLTGTRTEQQTPGAFAGSATPLRNITVVWHSDALNADLERTQTDPENGTDIWTLVDVKAGEPDLAFFHPPTGYQLRDVPAPASKELSGSGAAPGSVAPAGPLPNMSLDQALAALEQPDSAPVAAAVLMRLAAASTDPVARNTAIYAVARHNFDLPQAEALAYRNVTADEAVLTATSTKTPNPDILKAERVLARSWDTLGYTLEREKKDGAPWLLAAWTLDPMGYYGSHLGRAYEDEGRTADAVAIYKAALLARGSDREKQQLAERVAALTGQAALPAALTRAALPAHAVVAVASQPGKPATVTFLTGETAVGAAGAKAAEQLRASWSLPDHGPEHIVRFAAVDCADADHCATSNLPLIDY